MATDSQYRDQAYHYFVEEAPELLQTIESGLLTLRQEFSTAKVHEIMRAAHSIKGGAAGVGLDGIKSIAHRLEDIFKALYNAQNKLDGDLESKLLQAYDCLQKPLTAQLQTGDYDAERALTEAEPLLVSIETALGDDFTNADDFIPSSSELGVDMAASIFEVDVEQGIEYLRTVVGNPDNYDVAAETRAQAEVFAGLSEIVGLPGFGEIARAIVVALDAAPDRAVEIARIALDDLEGGRQSFLQGDRTQGGTPSPPLLAFGEESGAAGDRSSNVEDIFGSPIEVAASSPTAGSVEDIFGEPLAAEPAAPAAESNIDDIFGAEPLDVEPIAASSELSNVEDIFGGAELDVVAPSSVAEAVESIAEIFDRLPAIGDLPTAEAAPEPKARRSQELAHPKPQRGTASAVPNLKSSVRVDVERLERMDNQLGELVISRNRIEVQNDQLQQGVRELLNRLTQFKALAGGLQELADKLLASGGGERNQILGTVRSHPEMSAWMPPDFDALELDKYDALNTLLQELLEQTAQLEEATGDIALFAKQSEQTFGEQQKALSQLQSELMWARMLPISEVLNRFPRALRDLSLRHGKPVELDLQGTGVRIDKAVLERLNDPLMHLLRNAFDHGIESPVEREQNGKPTEGKITIRAYYQGSQTVIELSDDGRGINLDNVRKKALEIAAMPEEQVIPLSKERLYDLLFEPGFSTAKQVSDLSGRGVGLDVVRSEVRSLKGTIALNSEQGKGTTFTLRFPLTLSMSKLLICTVGTTTWAIPSDNIEEIIVPESETTIASGQMRFLYWQNEALPIYKLLDWLDYNCPLPTAMPDVKALGAVPPPSDWASPLLLMRSGRQLFAIEVDQLIIEQELVVKSFGIAIAPPNYVYGCTVLGDGTLIPVLDGIAVLERILKATTTTPRFEAIAPAARSEPAAIETPQIPTLLVIDDSATQRQTLTLSLQQAGYRVLQASDGREGISQWEQNRDDLQLIVCDIEMPNMNGYEFLRYRRQHEAMLHTPVVMLTSRSSEKHRQLAKHLGANDYFTKPYLESNFLAALDRLRQRQASATAPAAVRN